MGPPEERVGSGGAGSESGGFGWDRVRSGRGLCAKGTRRAREGGTDRRREGGREGGSDALSLGSLNRLTGWRPGKRVPASESRPVGPGQWVPASESRPASPGQRVPASESRPVSPGWPASPGWPVSQDASQSARRRQPPSQDAPSRGSSDGSVSSGAPAAPLMPRPSAVHCMPRPFRRAVHAAPLRLIVGVPATTTARHSPRVSIHGFIQGE